MKKRKKTISGDRSKSRKFIGGIFQTVFIVIISMLLAIFLNSIEVRLDGGHKMLHYIEAGVASLAAVFVSYQLREQAKAEEKETTIKECEFIEDFNRSFIENEDMFFIERHLEGYYSKYTTLIDQFYYDNDEIKEPDILAIKTCVNELDQQRARLVDEFGKPGDEKRQRLVNYLVYLEGLATIILQDGMEIQNIDSLFGYRLFICINNPVVQEMELKKYYLHYRGIYFLYDKWKKEKERSLSNCLNNNHSTRTVLQQINKYGIWGIPMDYPYGVSLPESANNGKEKFFNEKHIVTYLEKNNDRLLKIFGDREKVNNLLTGYFSTGLCNLEKEINIAKQLI